MYIQKIQTDNFAYLCVVMYSDVGLRIKFKGVEKKMVFS